MHFFTYLLINFIVFSKYKVTSNECSDKWLVLFLVRLEPGHEIGQGFVHKHKTSQVLGMCECGFQDPFGHLRYALKKTEMHFYHVNYLTSLCFKYHNIWYTVNFENTKHLVVTFLVSNWRPSWIFFVSFSLFLLRYFSYKFCASDFSETTWSFLMKFLHLFSKRLGLLELILCTNIRIPFMYYSTSYILLSKQGIHPPFPKSAALASSLEKEPQRFYYSLIIV